MITKRVLCFVAAMACLAGACVEPQRSLPTTGIYKDASSLYCLRVTKDRIEVLSLGSQRRGDGKVPIETCQYTLERDNRIWLYGMTSNQALLSFNCVWDGGCIVMTKTVMGKSESPVRLEKLRGE